MTRRIGEPSGTVLAKVQPVRRCASRVAGDVAAGGGHGLGGGWRAGAEAAEVHGRGGPLVALEPAAGPLGRDADAVIDDDEAHEIWKRIAGAPAHIIDFEAGLAIERAVHAMARSHAERAWVRVGS